MSEHVAKVKSGKKIKWWMWPVGLVVLLFLIGAIGAAFGLGQDVESPTADETASASQTETPAPTPEPTVIPESRPSPEKSESAPEETQTPEEPAPEPVPVESLADNVWAQIESNFPDGISSGSPLFAVTEVEDVSSGTIRVYVQENLNDDGRALVARHVVTMGALDNDELQTVVVRDASGIDSNHYRRDMF